MVCIPCIIYPLLGVLAIIYNFLIKFFKKKEEDKNAD